MASKKPEGDEGTSQPRGLARKQSKRGRTDDGDEDKDEGGSDTEDSTEEQETESNRTPKRARKAHSAAKGDAAAAQDPSSEGSPGAKGSSGGSTTSDEPSDAGSSRQSRGQNRRSRTTTKETASRPEKQAEAATHQEAHGEESPEDQGGKKRDAADVGPPEGRSPTKGTGRKRFQKKRKRDPTPATTGFMGKRVNRSDSGASQEGSSLERDRSGPEQGSKSKHTSKSKDRSKGEGKSGSSGATGGDSSGNPGSSSATVSAEPRPSCSKDVSADATLPVGEEKKPFRNVTDPDSLDSSPGHTGDVESCSSAGSLSQGEAEESGQDEVPGPSKGKQPLRQSARLKLKKRATASAASVHGASVEAIDSQDEPDAMDLPSTSRGGGSMRRGVGETSGSSGEGHVDTRGGRRSTLRPKTEARGEQAQAMKHELLGKVRKQLDKIHPDKVDFFIEQISKLSIEEIQKASESRERLYEVVGKIVDSESDSD